MRNVSRPLSIDKVLFATDFSPASANALAYAVAIANRYDSKLCVAHVINTESFELLESESTRLTMVEHARTEAQRKIHLVMDSEKFPSDRYEVVVTEGFAADGLLDLIGTKRIDLAILGTRGRRGMKKMMMGSVAEEVFRAASCPVLTAGEKTEPVPAELKHVVYPAQFSPDSSNAALWAVSLAERYGAKLTVMNVRDAEAAPANESTYTDLNGPVEHWINSHVPPDSPLRRRIHFELGFGTAADAILDYASKAKADLIVMSVRRVDPKLAARLPKGDTAYELATQALCPVLTVGDPEV